jgi:glycosyltransferase involved in cell wall biosynthesis
MVNTPWGRTGQISNTTPESQWIRETLVHSHDMIQNSSKDISVFDIGLFIGVPNEFERLAPISIGYTAGIETTRVSPQWLHSSNTRVDKLIVVSNHSRKVFENTQYDARLPDGTMQKWGLRTPVDVVNYPATPVEAAPLNMDFQTENNFLAVAQWGPRKNLENTIKWFVEAFEDDETVGLVLKTNTASDCVADRELTSKRLKNILAPYSERKCKVYLIHGEISPENLTWLYTHPSMKALINIGHGEGYGLPLFEAAYNGLPLVTTAWSGQMDFICKPNKKGKSYPRCARVDFNLEKVQESAIWNGIIEKDSMWAFAKEASYKRALADVLQKETHYRKEAASLQTHILENFTEEKLYEQFCNIVNPDYGMAEKYDSFMELLDED